MITNVFVKTYFDYAGYIFKASPGLLSLLLPGTILVEASNSCMLRCPSCATVHTSMRPKGLMLFESFKQLMDSIDWKIKRINFSYAGEPLVNPELGKMILYAKKRGISSIVETNGMLLEEHADDLLSCGLDKLNIAFDGVNQEMISKYRKGIDFSKVVAGIKEIISKKNRGGNLSPEIHLQFIVMKHNQEHVEEAVEMARSLGADYIDIKSMILSGGHGLSLEKKKELADEFLPTKKEFIRYAKNIGVWRLKKSARTFCSHLLSDTVIMWNGDVTICTMDVDGNLLVGNAFETPLRKIWSGETYRKMRKRALAGELHECKECAYLVSDFTSILLRRKC